MSADPVIERAVELLAPRDDLPDCGPLDCEVSRIILRAACIAAADVTHETGDPDTFAALLAEVVLEAVAPAAVDLLRRETARANAAERERDKALDILDIVRETADAYADQCGRDLRALGDEKDAWREQAARLMRERDAFAAALASAHEVADLRVAGILAERDTMREVAVGFQHERDVAHDEIGKAERERDAATDELGRMKEQLIMLATVGRPSGHP